MYIKIGMVATKINKMGKLKDRTGEKNISYQGYTIEVIKCRGSDDMDVKFNDERGTIRKNVAYKEFKVGNIKNPFHKEVLGIGYIGEGEYTARVNKKMSKCYNNWFAMFNRCYNPLNNRCRSYENVTVNDEWHNYQVFAKWFYDNYDPLTMQGWHLDKDLLIPGNREYSSKACCFIPNEVNVIFKTNNQSLTNLPRGAQPKDGKFQSSIQKFGQQIYLGFFETPEEAHQVYMEAKKEYLIEVSEKWRGVLSDKVCDAIKNYDISLL